MNPARTLHKLFIAWNEENSLNVLFSSENQAEVTQGVRELHQAARSFQELDYYLSLMEEQGRDVSLYRSKIPNYFDALTDSARGFSINSESVETLVYLADVIDSFAGEPRILQKYLEEEAESLSEQLSDLIQNFLDDETLDETLKNHAVMLCEHIKENLNNAESAGYFDFAKSVSSLKIYVDAAAERSRLDKFKQAFRKFNEEFLKHPLAPYVITATGAYFGVQELGQ